MGLRPAKLDEKPVGQPILAAAGFQPARAPGGFDPVPGLPPARYVHFSRCAPKRLSTRAGGLGRRGRGGCGFGMELLEGPVDFRALRPDIVGNGGRKIFEFV